MQQHPANATKLVSSQRTAGIRLANNIQQNASYQARIYHLKELRVSIRLANNNIHQTPRSPYHLNELRVSELQQQQLPGNATKLLSSKSVMRSSDHLKELRVPIRLANNKINQPTLLGGYHLDELRVPDLQGTPQRHEGHQRLAGAA